jgi:hypothetical protein
MTLFVLNPVFAKHDTPSSENIFDLSWVDKNKAYAIQQKDSNGFLYAYGYNTLRPQEYQPPLSTPGFDLDAQFNCNTIGFAASFAETFSGQALRNYFDVLEESLIAAAPLMITKLVMPQLAAMIEWLNSISLNRYHLDYISCQDIMRAYENLESSRFKWSRQALKDVALENRAGSLGGNRMAVEESQNRSQYLKDLDGLPLNGEFRVIAESILWPIKKYNEFLEKYFPGQSMEEISQRARELFGETEIDPHSGVIRKIPASNSTGELETHYFTVVMGRLVKLVDRVKSGGTPSIQELQELDGGTHYVTNSLIWKISHIEDDTVKQLAMVRLSTAVASNLVVREYSNYIRMLLMTEANSQIDGPKREVLHMSIELAQAQLKSYLDYQSAQDERFLRAVRAINDVSQKEQNDFVQSYGRGDAVYQTDREREYEVSKSRRERG